MWRCCTFVMVIMATGCQHESGIDRVVPVRGQIMYEDKPVPRGSLVFKPDTAKGNNSPFEPSATIDEQGNYELISTGHHGKTRPGAPPGWYKVVIMASDPNPANPYGPAKSLIPARYSNLTTTTLNVEVVESPTPEQYTLRLTK